MIHKYSTTFDMISQQVNFKYFILKVRRLTQKGFLFIILYASGLDGCGQ